MAALWSHLHWEKVKWLNLPLLHWKTLYLQTFSFASNQTDRYPNHRNLPKPPRHCYCDNFLSYAWFLKRSDKSLFLLYDAPTTQVQSWFGWAEHLSRTCHNLSALTGKFFLWKSCYLKSFHFFSLWNTTKIIRSFKDIVKTSSCRNLFTISGRKEKLIRDGGGGGIWFGPFKRFSLLVGAPLWWFWNHG